MADVDRTSAGLQMVIPGCERRIVRKSPTRVDESGQGLMSFYKPSTSKEILDIRARAPLRPRKAQKAPPRTGLFNI